MNRIHRIVWNKARQCLVVVGENALTTVKSSGSLVGGDRSSFAQWCRTVLAVLALFQICIPPFALAQTVIRPDGRTQTTVGNAGNVYNVSTATQTGSNAFNSFSAFSVGAGNTVNLHVPSSAINLINIVRDQRTDIYGVLNAIKDGRIGGNVWFANPHGFVVGASGVVNVGSLTVTTPTQKFVDGFFSAPGSPDQSSVTQLLSGTSPRNSAAQIAVHGQINAIDGVSLSAGAINVAGTVFSGARFVGSAPDFTDVVNANGLASATNVVVREGRIEIVADGDVALSGTLAAEGGSGVRGGDVNVRAGGNVSLDDGALVSARGNGDNSSGGTVNIWADNNAVTRSGALVDASAGSRGDGGAIEFSAKNTVELAGGEFRADGMGGGKGGSVLIDPENIVVSNHILRGAGGYGALPDGGTAVGANLTLLADNEITVNENITISTRSVAGTMAADHASGTSTGNSGNLTLEAGSISLKSGSKLLAGADNGYAGGDVTLKATRNWTGEAKVSVDNATITGRNVALTANATYNDSILTSWLPVSVPVVVSSIDVNSGIIKASGTLNLGATSLIDVKSSGLSPLGMITAVSTANVDVHGASVLTAGGTTTLASSSTVTSKATPGGPNLATLPGDAGVAINVVVSTAKTHVGDSSSVTVSGGTLDLTAKNAVTATTTADSTAGGAVAVGGTVALSEITSVTQALIDGSATTSSTALKLGSESTNVVTTSAKAATKGAKKQTAAEKTAAPSKSEETLAKYKDQTTTSDGSVEVAAAVAIANVNSVTLADVASTGTQTATGAATVSSKASSSSTVTADGSSASGSVGVGAAVGVNVGVLVNQARVADNSNISSNGLTVSALMAAAGKNSFVTSATSGAGASNVGVAGALGTNVLVNTTIASIEGNKDGIGSGAAVNVNGSDVVVESANTSESKVTVGASVKPASATEPAAVGVGASVGMNVAVNTAVAEIGNGAVVTNAKDLDLDAKGSHTLTNAVTGGASGADVSVTPVAAITVAVNTTSARLGTGSQFDLLGAYTSSAEQASSSTTTATGQTQGNNVAVGASIALNNATDTVVAEIDRDISATGEVAVGTKSTARSSASATASATGGEKASAADAPPAKADGSAGKTVDQKVTAQGDAAKLAGKKTAAAAPASAAAGTSETAAKLDSAQEAPKTEDNSQGSGGVSVAAAVGVNVGVATTGAKVGTGRSISSGNGALKVSSVNETDASAKADGSQVDSGNTNVGVGAAVALNVGISTNTAVVSDNAVVNTKGLTVSAVNVTGGKSDYAAEATSGAGAGNVGIAGSLAANVVVNTTVAALEGDTDGSGTGASVNAGTGNILIEAGNATTSTVKSGAKVTGTGGTAKVGVGASIGANIGVNTAVAEVADKAVLTGGANLGLNAKADHTLTTDVTGGASGAKVAVTPLAAVTVAVNTTTARLGESATDIGISGAYSSTAEQKSSATTTATGQTAGSNVAVGVSIGLTVATDTVTADIERDITATNGVELNAKSTAKSSTTSTASVAGGEKAKDDGTAPAAGGGAGSGQSVDQKVAAQGEAAKASGKKTAAKAPATTPAAGKTASDKLDDTTPPPKTEETTESGGVAVAAAVGINTGVATTTAHVGKGRQINSTNGALKVSSANATDTAAKADGSQVDSGNTSVGVGAAVALNVGISSNTATIGDNAVVTAKGLTVSAVNISGEHSDSSAEAKSGAGATNVGVAGSLAANIVVNTTVAALEGDTDSVGAAGYGTGASVNALSGDILIEAGNATTSTVKSGADVKGTDAAAKVGVGASIGVNVGVNTTVAEVADQATLTGGNNLGLNAKGEHTLTTDVTGGASGAKVAVTPLAAVTVAVNTTSARLGESTTAVGIGGKYSSTAEQKSSATTTATGQTSGSSVAVGASIGLTVATDTVTAEIERDVTATNGVELNAKSTAKSSTSATASVAGGEKAKDDGSAPAAGGGAGSGQSVDQKVAGQQNKATAAGKTTAAKAPATSPAAGKSASAKLQDSNDNQTAPKTEETTQSGGVAVAAAVGINTGIATTTAQVGKDRKITSSGGALKVSSVNETDASAKADGSQIDSGNTSVGVGAAVALNVGISTNVAAVGENAEINTKGLTISAVNTTGQKSDYAAEAKSGAGASNVGVAGSLAANIVVNTTVATLEGDSTSDVDTKGAIVNAGGGDILIEAANATTSTVKSGADVKGTDAAAKVGVGASIGMNVGVNTIVAEAGDRSEIINGKDFGLNAKADHTLTTDVTGGAAGAKVAVTPLAAVTVAVNTTTARLGESAVETTLSGKYSSTADHKSSATTTATGTTAGSSVAVGVSLGLTSAVDTVTADVERDINATNGVEVNAKSVAKSSTSATASVSGGDKAKDDGSAPAADGGSGSGQSVDDKVAGQQNKATAAGKTTAAKAPATTPAAGSSASSKLDTNKQTPPKGETSEGGVSVAAAVGVNVGVATTTARVGHGRKITSTNGALKVTSANQTDTAAKADGSQVDSAKSTNVGVGAAVALNVGVATTTAVVADETDVSTKGLTVSATGVSGEKSDSAAEAKSGAGAGNVGVAGSLAINSATNTTVALVEGNTDGDGIASSVDANGGAVLIEAQNATTSSTKVSADVKGTDNNAKVGVGASIGVNVGVNTTVAEVADQTRLTDAASVGVNATANHAMTTDVTGGAAGAKVSITPVVAATIAVNTTSARLGTSATALDVSGAYSSKAEQTSTIITKATGQAQGNVAVGASLGATIAVDNVSAIVERNLDAGNGLDLSAKSDTSLTTEVKAGAKGAKAVKKDASGNETPEKGTTVDEQKKDQLDFAKSRNSAAASVKTDTPEAKTPDTTEKAPGTDKPTAPPNNEKQGKKVSVAAAIGATVAYNQAKAEIAAGKTVGAGTGKLKVASTTDTNYRTLATGEAVSDDVGVAAAVALTATYNKTQASIGSGVTVSDAGDVEVSATSRQNRGTAFQKTMSAEAVSGASGGEVAVAGSLAAVGNWNETRASIDEGATIGSDGAPVGDVTVKSDETGKVAAQARAGALSTGDKSKAGVGASFAVLLSYNQNTAAVGYDANKNGSYLPTSVFADSLSVTATKNRVWFLVPTLADAKNFVVNDIKNLNFDALDPSTYLGSNNYYTEAVAGAAAKGNAAVAGAFAVNIFGNTTEAYLGNSVSVTAAGKQPAGELLGVEVAAHSDTQAISFVGGVAGAKKAGVGLAATSIVNLDQTLATIGDDAVVKSDADGAGVKVSAYARQDIANVGVAGGLASEGAAVAGVLGAIVSLAKTEAMIGEDAEVKSKGDVDVEATGDITAVMVAGGLAGGKNAGVGASIGANVLANATHAEIGDNAKVTAKNNLSVAADADEVAVTAIVAASAAEKAAVSGAFSTNVIVGETVAVVGQGTQINTDAAYGGTAQNVSITAHDDTVVVGITGGGAGGGKAGVGAALDTTVLVKTVKAYVEDDADGANVAQVNADRNVQIDAGATETLTSVSMGFAGGGNVGVGGAVSIVVNKNEVQAGIGKSAKVDSEGNVLVNAQDDVVAVLTAGAGAGGGDAGVGGSLAVATLLGSSKAYIGDNAEVSARGNADAATVYSGETVFSNTKDSPSAFLAKKTEIAKGVSVTAYNREDLITTVIGGAGGGTAGVAATVSANVIASTTEASIGEKAKINETNTGANADQRVLVKAVDETLLIDTALAAAGGGTAGVGGSGNVGVIVKNTTARVGKGADIKAKKAFELTAASSDVTVAPTVGLAFGGTAGVGGALAAVGVANTTQAYVDNGTSVTDRTKIAVTGGNLEVSADEFSSAWITVGTAVGGGTAGVGGALAVGVNASTTTARIGDYTETDASGTTSVMANSTENVNSIAIAGGGGGAAGVVGSVALDVVISKTEAGIGEHAKVNQNATITSADQSVDVSATDRVISVAASGSGAGGGAAGVGGSLAVTVALNTTSAYIDESAEVSAAKDVGVHAASDKYVNSATFAGTGGGAAGVAGGVSILAIGSLFDSDAKSGLNSKNSDGSSTTTQAKADKTTGNSQVGGALGESKQSKETKSVVDDKMSKLAVSDEMSDSADVPLKNTQAFIGYGAKVKAGRDVTVSAKDTTLAINANGAGAGGGAAGVAGSLGVTLLHDSAEALIANGAKVDAGRKLLVSAETGETVVNVGVTGYGGGAAGVGGSAAVNVVTSNTSAYIGDADINQEATTSTDRSVEVTADSNSNLIAVAGSGGGAGAAAVGGVLNVNTLAKKTTAFIGEGATVAADDNVIVDASSAQNIISAGISIQGAGAAAVGGAATVNVVANTTEAYIGSARDDTTKTAATVDSDGNVVVAASDDTLLIAVAGSGTGAGAAAVGGAVGANVISSQTRAYVGDNSVVNARGNSAGTTIATGATDNAAAGTMPSLPSGVSSSVDTDRDGTNDGNIGNGASFTLAGGGTSTGVNPSSIKDSGGNSVGSALGGLGAKGTETAKGLSVTATGNEKIVSAAIGVAGAGAAGVTGTATADIIASKTEASIGDGAQINQSGAVSADSDVRVRAADNSFVVMTSGTVAGAAGAGVSGSANVAVIAKETHATIGDADIKAGDVIVRAAAKEDAYVIDANVSFGAAGVGGAVGVAVVTNDTQAGIVAGATLDALGGIAVKAEQETSLDIYTVAGSAGIGAAAGAFSVGVIDNTTKAYVADGTALKAATLDAGGTTEIAASSKEEIMTGTVSASGGGGAVAGAVGVKVVTSETTAEIGDYAQINQTRRAGATQDVKVSATDSVKLDGFGGSGAVGAAFGAGATAEINVVRNTTAASVGDYADVRADNDIALSAASTKDVYAKAGALAGGGTAGIAGAVALVFVGANINSDSDAQSGIGNGATAGRADEKMKANSVSEKLGDNAHVQDTKSEISTRNAALGVSAELNDTTTDSRDKTRAFVGQHSELVAGNRVDVTATDKTQIDLIVAGAAGGYVGIGGAVGVGITHSTTEAFVDKSSTIDADGDVRIAASAANVDGDGSKIISTAGAAGVVGLSAAVAVLKDSSTTSASLADDVDVVDAAKLTVVATTDRKATTETWGASGAVLAIGASVSVADFNGFTTASLGIRVHSGADSDEISATDDSVASAYSRAGAAGVVAGSGSVATATVTSTVRAELGDNADLDATGDIDVLATSRASTKADAIGVNIGAGAVGASVATANSGAKVHAEVGENASITGASFDLIAKRDVKGSAPTAQAYALGAAGGLLLGANATVATAKSTGETVSAVGAGSTITTTGAGIAAVKAENTSLQSATGLGFASGVLSVGADFSYATSDSLTQASLGDNVQVSGSALQVVAAGSDSNYAYAKAGAGGLITVPFSAAYTTNSSRTYAGTGSGDATHKIDVANFYVSATHTANFDSWIDSTSASLIGVSGALAKNAVNATTEAFIGTSGYVEADNVTMQAGNTTHKGSPGATIPGVGYSTPGWNVVSSSGGLADVPAAESATTIVSDAQVRVGAGAHLEQTGSKASPGGFDLDAWNSVYAVDRVKMTSGGAISAASGKSSIMQDTSSVTNRVDSAVIVAPNAELSSLGEMALGARSDANVSAQTAVDVYGAVGVAPAGDSIARFKGSNRVEIGAAATLTSDNDIRLSAGENTSGVGSSYAATARSDVFNNTAIPVNRDPVADAIIDTSSLVKTGAGSDVAASRHISLYADKGSATASGVGVGKDIYRETLAAIASAISEFFGGDPVSFETRTGNSVRSQKSEVAVDGTVRTGTNRQQILEIDKNGVATVKAGDIHVVSDVDKGVASDLIERIRMLESLIDDYEVSGATGQSSIAVAAYKSEINFLKSKLKAMGFQEDPAKPGFYSAPASGASPRSLAAERLNAMTKTRTGYETTKDTLEGDNVQYAKDIKANDKIVSDNDTAIATKKASIKTNEDLIKTLDPKDDAVQIKNLQDANATLKQQYETLESQNYTINTVTNPGIQASIDANLPKINALDTSVKNLTIEINKVDLAAYSTTPFSGPTANFKSISDATAQLGNIYVRGDKLTGAGTLEAPGDAQIKITNYSPSYMILHNLSIASNTGGKIYFNGVDVNSSAEINSVNGGSGAAFSVKTAKTQAAAGIEKPTIEIISNFNPLSADYLGSTEPEDRKLAPDIILHGDISNLNGLVRIKSEAGSIRLEQKRDENEQLLNPVQTAGIRANSVELSTKSGDFVQSYTDSFYHVAGRGPIKLIEADDKLGTMDSLKFESEVAGSGIVANGSVFIAARYLNINGIVQSGMSEWGVSIPAGATVVLDSKSGVSGSFADAIANYAAKSIDDKAKTGAEYYAVSGATVAGLTGNKDGDWQKVDVFFNAKENRLELNGVQVQGGYIELFGQIINTNKSGGELRVLDGYGKIKVENNTNLALVVNMLNTGNNIEGKISITNILGFNPDGSLIVQGGGTQVFKRNGGSRDGGEYSLTDGMRYAMQVGYDTGTTEYYRYSQSGWFDIASTFTGLALDNYRLYSDPPKTNPMLRGEYLITGSTITDETKVHPTENIPTFAKLTKGASWKDCNWWTLCMNATYYQEFALETKAKVIDSNSVSASNPIKIKYIGYDQGEVSINSNGNVLLAGSVANLGGNTTITSTQGSITQKNETVQVSGTNIALNAKTGIGDSTQSLRVNAGDSGRVDAATQSGDIYVREMLGDFRVGNIGGADVMNVVLQSDRNMVNAGAGSWVQGQRVELLSDDGAIGATGDPLTVRTAYSSNTLDWPSYGLKATARDNINLRNEKDVANAAKFSGNLLLISAESLTGDVRIETSGSVIDNNPIASTDVRSQAELAALWDDLRLRGDKADDKANDAIDAFVQGKNVNYALYWRMRNSQADGGASYNANYQLTSAERSSLATSGMTGDEINTFEANRRTQYQQLHADVGGLTTAYQGGYSYTVSEDEKAQIRKGSKWTEAQLQLSVGAGLLKNLTDTVTTIKAPNAKGRNVTLIAGENIGSYNPPVTIDLSDLDALDTAAKAALAAAERGDAIVSADNRFVTVVQPRPVNVAVGTGALNASAATGYVLIGSEQDLRIEQVSAATDIRIKTAGGLINGSAVPGATNISGDNLILEASSGGIGGETDADGNVAGALVIDIDGQLIARAAKDVWIDAKGELKADTAYSRMDMRLDVQGSILDAHVGEQDPNKPLDSSKHAPEINLRARNIVLNSATGSVGEYENELDVGVNRDGFVSVSAPTFGKGVYLNAPSGEYFNIGTITSGDAVTLRSATDMTIDGAVTGPGPLTMQTLGAMKLTPTADVHATTLGVFLRAGSLEMQDAQFMVDHGQTLDPKYAVGDAARMRVDVGTIDIQTKGDALITGIETGNGSASAIRVVSTEGRILDNGDTRLDIIADTGPAAKLTIEAAKGIGDDQLDMRLLNLEAKSGGVVDINVQNGVNIVGITADDRVWLTAGADITGTSVTSTGTGTTNPDKSIRIDSTGGLVDLDNVSGKKDVSVAGFGGVSVDTLDVGTNLNLAGPQIYASVNGGSTPVGGSITGYGGGVADSIDLVLSGSGGFSFGSMKAKTADVTIPLGSFSVNSLVIVDRATISNPQTDILVDQHNKAIQPTDVQLFSDGDAFSLSLNNNRLATDSFVIHRSPMHEVITPDGANTSVDEQGSATLAKISHQLPPGDGLPDSEDAKPAALVSFSDVPVSLECEEGSDCEQEQ